MKITFVLPAYPTKPIGGFRIVYLYANYLAAHGHTVTVVHALKYGPLDFPTPSWPRALRLVWRRFLYRLKSHIVPPIRWQPIHPKVRLVFVPGDPDESFIPDGDAVFATFWWTANYIHTYSPSKGRKFYLIQHWEEVMGVSSQAIAKTWLLPLEKIVIARWLMDKGECTGARDMYYIPNGIDLNVFKVTRPIRNRPASILTLYHTAQWKGVSDAIAALQRVHERYPDVPITMFGTTMPKEAIPKWITFVCNPPIDQLVDLYNSHSIYLAASLTEGWALPPAEAMACGCTVVGTDIGGFREYVIPNVTGLLSPVSDPNMLYANLAQVIENEDYRIALQRAANEHIQQFSLEAMGSHLLHLLNQQISDKKEKEKTHG
ncbi:hypothetical protein BXT84_10800 [Sulfobacillus thermotolerans]|uniref:Glycosyl transferase family 1 domain-containing protein n=1 Tax=Sulfobacillus thermotolerans TaxID=338644 RepID=A0ABN5H4G9_9FIRM|nr:hypothetical protein BXT84_10800 [Sulfobacillus thermotolerans]